MNNIGDRIVNIRDGLDINQKTLAEKINVTCSTMCKYENNINIPNAEILRLLADVLDTTTDYLTCRTDIKYNPYRGLDKSLCQIDVQLINVILSLSYDNKIRILERAETLREIQDGVTSKKVKLV